MKKLLLDGFFEDDRAVSTTEADKNSQRAVTGCAINNSIGVFGHKLTESRRINGVVVGKVVAIDDSGAPLVDCPSTRVSRPISARAVLNLTKNDVGRQVVLVFEEGDPRRPIVIGIIQSSCKPSSEAPAAPMDLIVDGERIAMTAKKEILLRCGNASITLTRAGKVLIRGAYLLTRSSGANRIKGATVQIN